MIRTLRRAVSIRDDRGAFHVFEAGTTPPEWAARRITNRTVWADATGDAGARRVDQGGAAQPAATPAAPPATTDPGRPEPPRAGPGSNRRAWADYAEAIGIEVTPTDGRDAIIAAVDGAVRAAL